MAVYGTGNECDITFLADANLKTSTTQYLVVGGQPGTTTADRTVGLCLDTSSASGPTAGSYFAVGINQTLMSAGSNECKIGRAHV